LLHNGAQQLFGAVGEALHMAHIVMIVRDVVAGSVILSRYGKRCLQQNGTVLAKTQPALRRTGIVYMLVVASNLVGKYTDAGAVLCVKKERIAPVVHHNVYPVAGQQKMVIGVLTFTGKDKEHRKNKDPFHSQGLKFRYLCKPYTRPAGWRSSSKSAGTILRC
jgi:hypothetical protein